MGVKQRCPSRLCSLFGVPDIDLFASRLNQKVPKYASWKSDPLPSLLDAFTLNWREFSNAYAFPPFCFVGRCLQKVILPQATLAVVVLLWCTQAWLTRLLKPSNRPPKICQSHQESLSQSNSRPNAPIQPQAISTGMHNTREGLIKRNIPRDITNVIMRSWREGTQKQYRVYLKKWDEFCVQRQINSLQTSVYEISCMIGLLKVFGRQFDLHAQR